MTCNKKAQQNAGLHHQPHWSAPTSIFCRISGKLCGQTVGAGLAGSAALFRPALKTFPNSTITSVRAPARHWLGCELPRSFVLRIGKQALPLHGPTLQSPRSLSLLPVHYCCGRAQLMPGQRPGSTDTLALHHPAMMDPRFAGL